MGVVSPCSCRQEDPESRASPSLLPQLPVPTPSRWFHKCLFTYLIPPKSASSWRKEV